MRLTLYLQTKFWACRLARPSSKFEMLTKGTYAFVRPQAKLITDSFLSWQGIIEVTPRSSPR
jgi:hypothetical protein